MNCKDMKSLDDQNTQIRRDLTVETGKPKICKNNCSDCPNKQPLKAVYEISKLEK